MGSNDEEKSIKVEKPSSPENVDQANQNNQTNIHVYPDWAAMQAYYGPRVTLAPYYNSAIASGHAPPPYVWGPPQPMMPPYGAPYAAIYSHGGVYTHPGVPLAATPLSMETPTKLSGNTDQGLVKKLKEFDELAMSIRNDKTESADDGAKNRLSQSLETEGSSDGSDGGTAVANQTRRKRSPEGTPATAGDGKTEIQASPVSADIAASSKSSGGKMVGGVVSPGMTISQEFRNSPSFHSKTSAGSVAQPCAVLPSEAWLQNERELKRERRKQSNRESARRSRLRKQAEAEELAQRVKSLAAENETLKSEISRLTDSSKKLRLENGKLMEKMKNARVGKSENAAFDNMENRATTISTANLLSRINNSNSIDRSSQEESEVYEKKPNSGAKLHNLLDASPRTDAVAAG